MRAQSMVELIGPWAGLEVPSFIYDDGMFDSDHALPGAVAYFGQITKADRPRPFLNLSLVLLTVGCAVGVARRLAPSSSKAVHSGCRHLSGDFKRAQGFGSGGT